MAENKSQVRPANLTVAAMADEIAEDPIGYNLCCLCGKKRGLRPFKHRKICANCLNFVKTKLN